MCQEARVHNFKHNSHVLVPVNVALEAFDPQGFQGSCSPKVVPKRLPQHDPSTDFT